MDRMGVWFKIDNFELRGPIRVTLSTSLNMFKLTEGKDDKKVLYFHFGQDNSYCPSRCFIFNDAVTFYGKYTNHECHEFAD